MARETQKVYFTDPRIEKWIMRKTKNSQVFPLGNSPCLWAGYHWQMTVVLCSKLKKWGSLTV